MGLTYARSGVDIRRKDLMARAIARSLSYRRKGRGKPMGGIGHFAGLVDLGKEALAITTDGVGTKLLLARALGRFEEVGIDCVAMNVNDLICVGAEPLAFVDYLAVAKPDVDLALGIGRGLERAAQEARVSIVGGETAVVPSLVHDFDLAGTAVGIVEKRRIVTGERIREGDLLVGLPSSGLHSNGFTLARKALEVGRVGLSQRFPGSRKTLGELLLTPTTLYVQAVLELLSESKVHGIAHITGSGLLNIPRLRPTLKYVIDSPLPVPPIFEFLQRVGGISKEEMYRTFNMGMGLVVVVPPSEIDRALEILSKHHDAQRVGRVERGRGVHIPSRGVVLHGAKF